MLEFKYDTQLLIEGENLDEDKISEYFTNNFNGDCLLAVGDEELIKIHFHTTMNVYAHSTRDAKRKSVRLLDKVVGND